MSRVDSIIITNVQIKHRLERCLALNCCCVGCLPMNLNELHKKAENVEYNAFFKTKLDKFNFQLVLILSNQK